MRTNQDSVPPEAQFGGTGVRCKIQQNKATEEDENLHICIVHHESKPPNKLA